MVGLAVGAVFYLVATACAGGYDDRILAVLPDRGQEHELANLRPEVLALSLVLGRFIAGIAAKR